MVYNKIMRHTIHEIEQMEEDTSQKEYGMEYEYLPGDVKLNIHNFVLEKLNLKKMFNFKCIDCGLKFTEDIEGGMVEIYDELTDKADDNIVPNLCKKCKNKRRNSGKTTKLSVMV